MNIIDVRNSIIKAFMEAIPSYGIAPGGTVNMDNSVIDKILVEMITAIKQEITDLKTSEEGIRDAVLVDCSIHIMERHPGLATITAYNKAFSDCSKIIADMMEGYLAHIPSKPSE